MLIDILMELNYEEDKSISGVPDKSTHIWLGLAMRICFNMFLDIQLELRFRHCFMLVLSQDSVPGPILCNFLINDVVLFIKEVTLYNYADDNTLSYFSNAMLDLVRILEKETNVALTWLDRNEMIANPDKFNALLVRKDGENTTGQNISFQGHAIQSEETVKLLGVTLDNKLNLIHIYQTFVKKLRHN